MRTTSDNRKSASRRSGQPLWICAVAAWMTGTCLAFGAMNEYASRPCRSALAPTSWPSASRVARTKGRGTLVMVAHTKCSCTRASLRELERVMSRAGSRVEAVVVFVGPPEANRMLDLRASARAIPGVRVVEDENEARLFGAATSGQVLLYDEFGRLIFRGGLAPSRGHEGASTGSETARRFATATAARAGTSKTSVSEVFGCALFDTQADPKSGASAQASGVGKEP